MWKTERTEVFMKGRTILIPVLAMALAGICGLCALTGYGTYSWLRANDMQLRFFSMDTVSATVIETRSFDVTTPTMLEVETDHGDITVTAAEVETIEVEIIKKAWAGSKANAQTIAEGMEIDITHAEDKLTLAFQTTEPFNLISISNMPDSVSFNIRVPTETSVILATHRGGDVALTGTSGNAELSSSFGNVQVTAVEGALSVSNSNGDITAERIDAGDEFISLETSFGDINVISINAGDIEIVTANGDISIDDLTASGDFSVRDRFGHIEINDVSSADLNIDNQNGRVEINRGKLSGLLEVSNGFGDIHVLQVVASNYILKTNNGELKLDEASGMITMDNSFGDIIIQNAGDAILDLETNNGKVRFTGSLDESAAHIVESSFGDIILTIPPDSAFDLYLKTEFGEITSDMPVMISGNLSETKWEGALNGGGEALRAETNNGDIALKNLSSE